MPGVDLRPADVGDHPERCLLELRVRTWLSGSTMSFKLENVVANHASNVENEAVIIQCLLPGAWKRRFKLEG